jgi:hypothetical protein
MYHGPAIVTDAMREREGSECQCEEQFFFFGREKED